MSAPNQCPKCGAALPASSQGGVCPKCLLQAGLENESGSNAGAATVPLPAGAAPRVLLEPGQQFGGYRIERLLGQGGMGAVYEAEHLETGRRVALKVLGRSLDSPEVRRRFLREGRLAASINHPNSVYVFGTEEIEGAPAIAMELVAGGTLQDRVRARGPLPMTEAVEIILQIMNGLEAAQAVGVLHRDVKPANCFIGLDGSIKIGDFGLSISTVVREETALTVAGSFMGTPAFSSPEQIRGDELTLQSDIYAVGVTLHYLLTGHTPFTAHNAVQLLANVLERPPESPAQHRPDLPPNLCKIVLRCLEKQPGQRYRTYADLRRALLPFTSTAPTPATLGFRVLANVLDMALWAVPGAMVSFLGFDFMNMVATTPLQSGWFASVAVGGTLLMILYYALTEGLAGASLGKVICQLRVVGPKPGVVGMRRALLRAMLFVLPPVLPSWCYMAFFAENVAALGQWPGMLVSWSYYLILGLIFATARRRNGFAGLHELATATRVIRRARYQERPPLSQTESATPAQETSPQIGPYHLLDTLGASGSAQFLLAYDLRLLRKVWIRQVPHAEPPLPPHLRQLGRPGRLRWLGGKRTPEESWDSFEGPSGKPLLELLEQPQPWNQVRFWLLDLAQELQAATQDNSLPILALDRVWITTDGRAKLLDFPAPRTADVTKPDAPQPESLSPTQFLQHVALSALCGRPVPAAQASPEWVRPPLPRHARAILLDLAKPIDLGPLLERLKESLTKLASVSRARRLAALGFCLIFPLLMLVGMFFSFSMVRHWSEKEPHVMPLFMGLENLSRLRRQPQSETVQKERAALEIYLAGRFRQSITNPASWSSLYAQSLLKKKHRNLANELLAAHPALTETQMAEAASKVEPTLDRYSSAGLGFAKEFREPLMVLTFLSIFCFIYVALPSLVAALAFRGGLVLLTLGMTVVRSDGADASRLRVFWRCLLSWLPLLFPFLLTALLAPLIHKNWAAFLAATVWLLLVVGSALLPQRSLQDRLAGTWLVPR